VSDQSSHDVLSLRLIIEIILLRSRRRSSTIQKIGAVNPLTASRQSPLPASKAGQLFIRTHNEALSVTAMRVSNPDRSPAGIHS
jgi:hypothetical protein